MRRNKPIKKRTQQPPREINWNLTEPSIPRLPSTALTLRGQSIRKECMEPATLNQLKKDLTFSPFVQPGLGVEPTPFFIYAESPEKIQVPRIQGLERFGAPKVNCVGEGDPISVTCVASPRQKQVEVINTFFQCMNEDKWAAQYGFAGIISMPCGFGKTFCAVNILSRIQRKTIIVVHKEFLMNQFRDEIARFMPGARVGIIQGKKVDVDDKDIVLAMVQSLAMREYPPEIFKGFGLAIFDECHHLGAEVFSRCLTKMNIRIMLGLSATPDRKDGCNEVFRLFLGEFTTRIKERETEDVLIRMVPLEFDDDTYTREPTLWNGKVNLSRLITQISEYGPRNQKILDDILAIFATEPDRRVLLLGDRKEQLRYFYNNFRGRPGFDTETGVGFYVGGMKPEDLEKSAECRVVLGTYAMAAEGMNIPALDTLIYLTPKGDIVQAVGRILRKRPEDRTAIPMVVDYVDIHDFFERQSERRVKVYKKMKQRVLEVERNPGRTEWNTLRDRTWTKGKGEGAGAGGGRARGGAAAAELRGFSFRGVEKIE